MSKASFDTRDFEKYAMSVLREFYCKEWSCFRYGPGVESPDLQCEALGVGIEVTRAISRENGIPAEIIFEYFGDWNQAKQENWHSIRLWRDYALLSPGDSAYEFKVHLDTLQNSIRTKTEKLNRIYRIFEQNHLYIFTFNPVMDRKELRVLWQTLRETQGEEIGYDIFFFDCVDRLLALHRKDGAIEEIALDAKRLRLLQQRAFWEK